jgi:hypothetical protein
MEENFVSAIHSFDQYLKVFSHFCLQLTEKTHFAEKILLVFFLHTEK